MKALLVLVIALSVINCSKVKFESDAIEDIQDVIDDGIDLGGDDITDEDIDDGDDDDDDDTDDDVLICPRYDLVVKSTHASNKRFNYRFNYNGETLQTSLQGKINVTFLKDAAVKYTQCSGEHINTTVQPTLTPLKAIEKLTGEIVINHDVSCAAMVPVRTTTLQVIDSANGNVLWDEQEIVDQIGACEFGYSTLGSELRNKIISLADGVVNKMADACNK